MSVIKKFPPKWLWRYETYDRFLLQVFAIY